MFFYTQTVFTILLKMAQHALRHHMFLKTENMFSFVITYQIRTTDVHPTHFFSHFLIMRSNLWYDARDTIADLKVVLQFENSK